MIFIVDNNSDPQDSLADIEQILDCLPPYLFLDSGCFECPVYTRPSGDYTECIWDDCNNFEIKNKDGTCSKCPNY